MIEKIKNHIDNRKNEKAHKGDFGRLLLVCGSKGMSGAAILSAKASVRAGAGLVTLATAESNYSAVAGSIYEVMQLPMLENPDGTISVSNSKTLLKFANKSDALLYGCGIGKNYDKEAILELLMSSDCKQIVLDADGINALHGSIDLLCNTDKDIIITPHSKEMARLLNITVDKVEADRSGIAQSLAKKTGITVVLKGHNTVVAGKNGELYINNTGNCGMAKGGSGDVLAGMTASILAQSKNPFMSAVSAVYLHGLAGDIASDKLTKNAMLPSDIIDFLPQAFYEVLQSD